MAPSKVRFVHVRTRGCARRATSRTDASVRANVRRSADAEDVAWAGSARVRVCARVYARVCTRACVATDAVLFFYSSQTRSRPSRASPRVANANATTTSDARRRAVSAREKDDDGALATPSRAQRSSTPHAPRGVNHTNMLASNASSPGVVGAGVAVPRKARTGTRRRSRCDAMRCDASGVLCVRLAMRWRGGAVFRGGVCA